MKVLGLLFALAFLGQGASISSFTGACYSGAAPASSITCAAGDNIILTWTTTGATTASLDHSIGPVTPVASGTYTVQPFNVSSITYTLAVDGGVQASVTVALIDDYALMSAWPTTIRAYGFDSSIPCDQRPYTDPAAHTGDYPTCGSGLDATKAVSNSGSIKFTIPGVAAQSPSGDVSINFSANGNTTFGEGSEFYLQIREYMDGPYVTNTYLRGSACNAHLTMTGVTGTFAAGDSVTSTGVVGSVVSWSSPILIIQSSSAHPWLEGDSVTDSNSGGHGTISTNNGGGLTPGDCPGDDYGTGMKQAMLDPADHTVPPSTSADISPNCLATHIVTSMDAQRQYGEDYMGCMGLGDPGQYQELRANYFPSGGTSPSILIQTGQPCPYTGNGTLGQKVNAPCVPYTPGEWMTVQYHVKIGTWYLLAPSGYPTATFDVSGGAVTAINIISPGRDWVPGTTIILGQPTFTANYSGNTLTLLTGPSARSQWASQEIMGPDGTLYQISSVTNATTIVLNSVASGIQGGTWYLRGGAGNIPWNASGGAGSHGMTASATCPVNTYGQIPACYLDSGGSGYTNGTGFEVRWPVHGGGLYRRDSTIEKWQARAGRPSLLLTTMPYYDLINASPYPQDWGGNGCGSGSCLNSSPTFASTPPWKFGKLWLTPYSTGRDANAGPYPAAHIWYDNLLVGTRRFADPGVGIQPVTNLTIDKTHFSDGNKTVALSWENNSDSSGGHAETGFDVERCAGHLYDCMAGNALAGTSWTVVSTNHSGTIYNDRVPTAAQVYTYRVRAVNGSSCSASVTMSCSEWSTPVTTAPKPPSNAAAQWTPAGVRVSWVQRDEDPNQKFAVERCTGVFQYKLIYGNNAQLYQDPYCVVTGVNNYNTSLTGDSGRPFAEKINNLLASTVGSTLTWTDTTAVPGTQYAYRVRSYNGGGSWRNFDAGYGTWMAYSSNVMPIAASTLAVVTSCPLAVGTQNASYNSLGSGILTATGGSAPYSWDLSGGSLPAGLDISGNSIVGTPTGTGPSNFTLRVTDSASATATQSCSLTINEVPSRTAPTITTTSLPHGTVGVAYSQTLQATGTPATFTWTLASGTLAGCNLTLEMGGAITGTPSTATTCTFTAAASNGVTPDATSGSLEIVIDAAPASVVRVFRGGRVIRSAVH